MSWQFGIYKRLIKKLELIGCVRRMKAVAEGYEGSRSYSCLKFIREPGHDEWRLPWNASLPEGVSLACGLGGTTHADADSEDDGAYADERPSNSSPSSTRAAGIVDHGGNLHEVGRLLPLWRPRRPIGNLLYQIVDAAGTKGISTMVGALL